MVQGARARRGRGLSGVLGHLGTFGLFLLAIVDSSPLPTFGGPDILIAILAATHRNPWYEYASVATAGSLIGAYLTFHLARRAGAAYLHSKFGKGRVPKLLNVFGRLGTGGLMASTAIPLPFPTSAFFAAAGASGYRTERFLTIVGICRAVRYAAIGIIADRYGRHFVRVLRHPTQYWGWLLLFAGLAVAFTIAGIAINRRLSTVAAD